MIVPVCSALVSRSSHSSRDSQRGLALHLTAVERMAVQIERR